MNQKHTQAQRLMRCHPTCHKSVDFCCSSLFNPRRSVYRCILRPKSSSPHHRHCDSESLGYIILWVAGGICLSRSLCNRNRGNPPTDLKLILTEASLYYITLRNPNSSCQSAPKTHKTLIILAKQPLTRRYLCDAPALLRPKIHPWGPCSLKIL